MICDRCKYADRVTGYPDGEDMFTCSCPEEKKHLIPFDMEEDTDCPVFEEAEE